MRFGKKTFIISVIAFVLCLNLGFLSVAYFSYVRSVKAHQEVVKLQYDSVAANFEATYDALVESDNGDYVDKLMENFVNRYSKDGSYLAFAENGDIIYSSFDKNFELRGDDSVSTITISGVRYTLVNYETCEKYQLFFAVDSSEIDRDFNSILVVYTLSAAVICLFITFLLYFTMSRSSDLVENAVTAMDRIAQGESTENCSVDAKGDLAVLSSSFDNMCGAINTRIDATNKNAEEKQLIVDVLANQLSAPLVLISRAAEEIINQNGDSDDAKNAKLILKQTNRLQNISEKLLDIAAAREKALRLTDVDVPSLLTDTAASLSRYAKSIGISVETSLLPMSVNADADLLSILFYNLAENAIKACHSGCVVMLSCGDGTVTVRDNGSGMSEKQLEMITKPFYKAENEGYNSYGAGLGLTLCKQIIDVHGATISFESEQGYGTTVTVNFNSEK